MITDFIIEIPVANSLRMTQDGINTNQLADFDQRRMSNSEHATMDRRDYFQMIQTTDLHLFQLYTNFPAFKGQIINCNDEVLSEIAPLLLKAYRNKVHRSTAKFATLNGKLFIFFQDTQEFTDDLFTVPGNLYSLNGKLPNINAKVGDVITYQIEGEAGFTSTLIAAASETSWNPLLQAEGYLTDIDYAVATPLDGLVQINYNEKEADLYYFPLVFTTEELQFFKIQFGLIEDTPLVTYTSEALDVKVLHKGSLALEYRHKGEFNFEDFWGYIYGVDQFNKLRFPANDYQVVPAGEIDVNMNDTGTPRMLRAVPFRQIIFRVFNIPSWLYDKLQIAFSHDTKRLNDYYWEVENFGQYEQVNQVDLGTVEINLRQVNDRTKKINTFPINITASFTPASVPTVFGGEEISVVFHSNTSGIFSFNLSTFPDWLALNTANAFSDGDIVTLTVSANATAFDRAITLIASSPLFDVTAELEITQNHDTSIPLFIGVDMNPVVLDGSAGANKLLNVSSSGNYNIIQAGHIFSVDKESGWSQLRITELTTNNTSGNRTGTVTLELQADNTKTVAINVSQTPFAGLTAVIPSTHDVVPPDEDQTLLVDVTAVTGTQWQASSPQLASPPSITKWLNFSTALKTGTVIGFQIVIYPKPPYVANRTALVTFRNVNNPSDFVELTITQNS